MSLSGSSKSQFSKLCNGEWPYLWLDATYLKV